MGKSVSKNPMATHPVANPQVQNPKVVRARNDIHDFDDPYLPDQHLEEGTVCPQCGAVYVNQRWTLDDKQRAVMIGGAVTQEVVCPGCTKTAVRDPQGIVTLRGDYWPEHREEILNLVRNEESRALGSNPLERIIDIREEGDELIIETTNEKLAQRIGRHIDKAHKGQIEYRWSNDNHLVRVYWSRSLSEK
jgi:hypothetical protein